MPQEKPRKTGTARIRNRGGMSEYADDETQAIRHQQSADDRRAPIRHPEPPTEDPFNRPYAKDRRGGERRPHLDPSWSQQDSVSAYQNMYHASRAASELVYAKSREHGLDPAVGFGLVEQESRFRQDAVSDAEAVGLAQVIPEQAGVDMGFTREELETSPEASLDAGFGYLKQLEGRRGNMTAALDAYNRGPTAALREPKDKYARKVLGKAFKPRD